MQNKHLPGIPSEAKVKIEGLDIGENQTALLKKIEELTLYLIEQDKRQARLQNEIDVLHKAVEVLNATHRSLN